MNNKIFESRISYWHEKEPNMKLFGNKSPLYFVVKYADDIKGIDWLGTKKLSDFVDGLALGYLTLRKTLNLEEAQKLEESDKSKILIKPVIDFINDHINRLIDSEIPVDDKFIVNGAEIRITREETKRHGKRLHKVINSREDVFGIIKDLITYKRNLFGSQYESTHDQNQNSERSKKTDKPILKFHEYLISTNQELLAEKLIPEFRGKKGRNIAIMVIALEEMGKLAITHSYRGDFFRAMTTFFGEIGTESAFNDFYFPYKQGQSNGRKRLLTSDDIQPFKNKVMSFGC